ncbi:MAG: PRC-barrel domain-containing protein [Bacillota bacterium]|nr:PRC-barrel domain-containing protein [Bacillota bacterium]
MELQSKQLLGLTVFSITDGKKLGQIKDYVLDPAARAVTARIV